ncbi:CotH kinase family protein, partial [bacterium]|nr:CotH kinase family protein [bacterium]
EFGVEHERVFGLKKMNLNGEHNDPSVIRSKLNWDLMEQMNVPASRCAHCRLYVNGEYRGLYIHVEEYDKTFLRTRFGNDDGNFYKCLWPADLVFISNNPNDYKFMQGDRRTYELHTNEEADDYSDLAHFINILNNAPSTVFMDSLEANFNVWNFLKELAVEVITGQWDDYWFNKNNYWLYHDARTGKFEFIPYDLDNTYGIWWEFEGGHDWGTDNIYDWGNVYNEPRPLVDRILEIPQYRNLYTYFVEQLLDEAFNNTDLFTRIDTILPLISPAAEADFYRTLDYGWSYQDFLDSYNSALGAHVYYGLRPYIITRENSARSQLEQGEISPVFLGLPQASMTVNPILVTVGVEVFDDLGVPEEVSFHRVIGDDEVSLPMEFVEWRYDGVIPYSFYSGTFEFVNPDPHIYYFLRAVDSHGNITTYPRHVPETLLELNAYPLVINEFLASNDTTLADEYGEYDDWLELYNNSDSTISLADWSLSDDPSEPDKWLLPEIEIGPHGFLVLWMDDDEEQGELHATFNLDRDGEFLGLYRGMGQVFAPVDTFTFGYQETDRSQARVPDGSPNWVEAHPTPGEPNIPTAVDDHRAEIPVTHVLLNIHPNPFNPTTTIALSLPTRMNVELEVFNLLGQLVDRIDLGNLEAGVHHHHFDGSKLPSGMYSVRACAGQEYLMQKMLLIR